MTFGKRVKVDTGAGFETVAEDAPPPADHRVSVQEALAGEVQNSALLAATVTSAINAFKRPNSERGEAAIKPYVPSEPAIIAVLRNGMLETDIPEDTVAVICDFFDSLGPARIALDRYFADANHIGTDRASALHLLTLATAWRRSCENAYAAIRGMNGIVAQLPALYAGNSKQLSGILQDVITGGTPCLDAKGHISVPELPQRRGSARRTICQPCTITHNRVTSQAFVRDVGPGGFGLERAPELAPKTLVQIELPSGRKFTGTVAWSRGSSAGIRFTKALLPNDPLLSG
jgi:hypothetical protein